ncbi:MAG: methionyl-tRNA formyltransferase [Lactobacillus sp.]|nr:methionyl-tRNA formyltransferase [Lactobacillus sp.]
MTSVIFLGTPQFAVPVLEGLLAKNYEVKAVVTQPDKAVGRKRVLTASPVKECALKHDLPVYQPAKLSGSDELAELKAMEADFLITAAYGQFLPTSFLKSAKVAAVNVHGSLLPKYRGGAPIQYALWNGDKETGVTIMEMVKEMDAGDMFAQAKLPIEATDNAGTIFEKMSYLGRDLLLETLPKILDGSVHKVPQDTTKVVFSPNISKEQEKLTLDLTAKEAENHVRALNPNPGAYFMVEGSRMKVWEAQAIDETTDLQPGSLVKNDGVFYVAMAQGTVLALKNIQPNGKKPMPVKAFVNGYGKKFAIGEKLIDE